MRQASARRLSAYSEAFAGEQIRRQTERNVEFFSRHPQLIPERLQELDREWDIERVLEMTSTAVSLAGLFLSARRHRLWLLVPWAVQALFLQHALQGHSAPLSFFRKRGIRTQSEIAWERYALKALRGDFRSCAQGKQHRGDTADVAHAAFEAAEPCASH